jgi:hypothetical protein
VRNEDMRNSTICSQSNPKLSYASRIVSALLRTVSDIVASAKTAARRPPSGIALLPCAINPRTKTDAWALTDAIVATGLSSDI